MTRVLVVDDTAFARMTIRNILEKQGFVVVGEAANGREGVEKYKELRPDVVTMDITMPEMNGLDALKAIMAFDPKAKVVMITAMGQEAMVRSAVLAGAKSFIVKPFKEDHVVNAIKKVLGIH